MPVSTYWQVDAVTLMLCGCIPVNLRRNRCQNDELYNKLCKSTPACWRRESVMWDETEDTLSCEERSILWSVASGESGASCRERSTR